jgi:hypothetical protein
MVQIESEGSRVHGGSKVLMRRGHDANIERDVRAAAESAKPTSLENTQQGRLQRWRELTDLVEKNRTALRLLERADSLLIRAGERALLVPEQFACDERR